MLCRKSGMRDTGGLGPRLGRVGLIYWALIAVTISIVLAINPVGFIGGGSDDWRYLEAARCWRLHGPCLPHNHWEGRWPLIAPIAAITGLLGETRLTVGLAPLLAGTTCLILITNIGDRLAGRPAGLVAALLFLTVPAFSVQLLDPTVEATELAFCLAGLTAMLCWRENPGTTWPFVVGTMFGLAFQTRETAAVAILFAGGAVLAHWRLVRWPQGLAV